MKVRNIGRDEENGIVEMSTIRRLPFIDVMKGIGIALVVFGHVTRNTPAFMFVYSFHMSLFFTLSGYFFKVRRASDLIRRRFSSLIVPYLVFSLLSYGYWWLIESRLRGGSAGAWSSFINIFVAHGGPEYWPYNSALWFLPCLFLTELLYFSAYKVIVLFGNDRQPFFRERNRRLMLLVASFCIASFWMAVISGSPKLRLPWMADVAPVAIVFYALGSFLSTWSEEIVKISALLGRIRLLGVFLSAIGYVSLFSCVALSGISVNYMELVFPSPIVFLLVGFWGIAATYVLASSLATSKTLEFMGKSSLAIMGLHEPIKRVVIIAGSFVMGASVEQVRQNIGVCILFTAATLVLSCVAGLILSKIEGSLNSKNRV